MEGKVGSDVVQVDLSIHDPENKTYSKTPAYFVCGSYDTVVSFSLEGAHTGSPILCCQNWHRGFAREASLTLKSSRDVQQSQHVRFVILRDVRVSDPRRRKAQKVPRDANLEWCREWDVGLFLSPHHTSSWHRDPASSWVIIAIKQTSSDL